MKYCIVSAISILITSILLNVIRILRERRNDKRKFEERAYFEERAEKDKIPGLDRDELLCSDERYKTEYMYCADFLGCTAYYNYIGQKIPDISHYPYSDLINEESNMLSARNLACLENLIRAIYVRDKIGYWHELSDFIYNYYSKNAVSIDECRIFVKLYEVGCVLYEDSNRIKSQE